MALNGKNVCFVAGFGGIGLESCKNLLKKGIANLAILDVVENKAALASLKSEFPTKDIFYIQIDVTNKAQIEEAINKAFDRLKYIDILVNGAGVMQEQNPDLAVSINLTGLINTTFATIPYMDKNKGGRGGLIVNIASVLGLVPMATIPVYTATKHGIVGFTQSIGLQYERNKGGIACVAICPGVTKTPLVKDAEVKELFAGSKSQTAAEMGASFVEVLEKAKNASLWICDLGKIREVAPTIYWQLTPTDNCVI